MRRRRRAYARGDRGRRRSRGPQLLAAASRRGQRRGRVDHRRRGPSLSRLPGRVFGGELRPPPPRDHRDRARPARHRHAGQPRVPFRPPRPVLRRAGRPVRQGHGAADEQRRRSGRERHQGRAQMGHRRQGRPSRPGRISSWRTTTFTAAPSSIISFSDDEPPGAASARSHRASARFRSATPTPWPQRSTTTPSRCCWSPSRARRASSCRPTTTCRGCARCAREHNVLMIADEIQSGLARTGHTFACDHWGVVPDVYLLGKALGGGVVPLSAVVANRDVLGVLHPGEHGSTFGGNPLAAAIGIDRGRDAGARRIPAPLNGTRRAPARAAARAGRPRRARRARPRTVGGRRHRPGIGTGKRSACAWPSAACSSRTPTARRCGSRHRW